MANVDSTLGQLAKNRDYCASGSAALNSFAETLYDIGPFRAILPLQRYQKTACMRRVIAVVPS
jgi:hypothetical protein